MKAKLVENDDDGALVVVFDHEDVEHHCTVSSDGEVTEHRFDEYPLDPDERSPEQRRTIRQVRERARYAVHNQGEFDVLDPTWIPEALERGGEAIASMDLGTFGEEFEPLFDVLTDVERTKTEMGLDPADEVLFAALWFCVEGEDDPSVVDVADVPQVAFRTADGRESMAGEEIDCPGDLTPLSVVLPPIPPAVARGMSYPEDFWNQCINNMFCQQRDVYLHMGGRREDPIEGFGKPSTSVDPGLDVDNPWEQ